MPSSRKKPSRKKASRKNSPPEEPDYLKRRTFAQGKAEVDAAHVAAYRLYCEALRFWRGCPRPACKRHRCCLGEPLRCVERGIWRVPMSMRRRAQKFVIAGGPRRVPPATHIEWTVRRLDWHSLLSWFNAARPLPR